MACSACAASQNAACNIVIDYSTVEGKRLLPYMISLDTDRSILEPEEGENQRFCYRICSVGQNVHRCAELEYLMLGICDQIRACDLACIAVMRNGREECVAFGQNVELKTNDNPDRFTGCAGLKFHFPLDKVDGELLICIELTSTYEIGQMPTCLAGCGVTVGGLSLCGPVCRPRTVCERIGYQRMSVRVPITVTPNVRIGRVMTRCLGAPTVTPGFTCAPCRAKCCTFTMTQQLCVETPVIFGARAHAGEHCVECIAVSAENICEECE